MLGWQITVFRQTDSRATPATPESQPGSRLAVWQTTLPGIAWLDELVDDGAAILLESGGYPNRYTAKASHLIPRIADGPPHANETWALSEFDEVGENWEGRTIIDDKTVTACVPEEWLLVVAWDES